MADDDAATETAEQLPEDESSQAVEVEQAYGVPVTISYDQRVLHSTRDELIATVEALRADGFEQLLDVMGVDYLGYTPSRQLPTTVEAQRFEVVYLLISLSKRERIRIRVQVPSEDPVVPSLFEQYPGAEAPEREVFDMYGVSFAEHPDMCRILMPEDWVGHPLRKDYEIGRIPVQFKDAPARH
ncbi:MAG: NADH-quinone oxidoreductase subunit C [Acidimicrobiales bacterium]